MSACAANDRVITMCQAHDEIVTARCFGDGFHVFICRLRSSHTNVLPHRNVKQKIILRHIADQIHHLFRWQRFHIDAANRNAPAAHIPVRSNELGNGRFSGTRRTYERRPHARFDIETDAVQHLHVFVSKMYIPQRNIVPFQLFLCLWAIELRFFEYRRNLSRNGSDL